MAAYDAARLAVLLRGFSLEELSNMHEPLTMAKMKRFIVPRIGGDEAPVLLYIGVHRDHIIVFPFFCSCKHFVIRVMSEKRDKYCSHLLGARLAAEKKWYRVIDVSFKELWGIVTEIIYYGRSKTLRRKLYSG